MAAIDEVLADCADLDESLSSLTGENERTTLIKKHIEKLSNRRCCQIPEFSKDLLSRSVTTVIGTGQQGDDKVGGKIGTQQIISSPWDLTLGKSPGSTVEDVLYIAMAGTHQIWIYCLQDITWYKGQKYPAFTCVRFVGSGAEENRNNSYPQKAGLAQPSGIVISHDEEINSLFIADSESSTIRTISLIDGAVKNLIGGERDPNVWSNNVAMTMLVNTGISLRSMFLMVLMFACLTIYLWRRPDTYYRETRFTNQIIHPKHWTPKAEDKIEVEIVEDMLPLTTYEQPKPKPTLQPKPKPMPPTIYLSLKPMHCVVHGMRQQCVGPFHKNLIGVNQCQTPLCVCFPQELVLIPPKPIEDPNFPPKNEMLPIEQKMLHDEEFVDILTAASLNHSTLTLLNPKTQYNVGDVITVRINMVDGYGKQRVVGGDDVRVRMIGINNVHRASGNVMDFNNGSYTVTLKALWSGKVKIEAALPYTREAIATMLKWRRQYKTLFYYYGHFVKGTLSEYTMCSPYPTIQGYPSICNLTSMNYNYPWFCGRPINPLLSCDDFKLANDFDYTQIPVTPAQFITFDRLTTKVKLKSVIELDVSPGLNQQKQVTCNKLPRKQTWNITMPTGYFEKREWKLLKCKNDLTKDDIMSCLRNTTVIFYGDSTTRQWYKLLQNVTGCDQKTAKWTKPKWYEYSKCYQEKMNFTLIWAPHAFPFPNGRKEANGKSSLKPAVKTLEELPTNGKIVFVLHYFCHYARQHYTLFRDQIRSLKPALRKALGKNKDLHVAIKAPHVFYETMCPSHLNDFPGPVFTDILQQELKEFQDSVWYLNLWDMNLAIENGPIHPSNHVVWQYLKMLFGFTCK